MRCWFVVLLAACGRFGFDGESPPDAVDPAIVELSIRGRHACVRSNDKRVACWGSNEWGQLGRGNLSLVEGPRVVDLANVERAVTGEFTTFAIDSDGALWGWGYNEMGQIGIGTLATREATPRRIQIPERVVDLAAGQFHACARTETDALYCWGDNRCGQLGTGTTAMSTTPTKVRDGVRSIAINDYETCVTDATGDLACVGGKYSETETTCVGTQLAFTPTLGTVRDVQGGCHTSMCAADTNGVPWCWGENISAVLGNSGSATIDPVIVDGIANITKITTGFRSSCAANSAGSLFCWGENTQGQLGIGTTVPDQSSTPRQVAFFAGQPIDQVEVGCANPCVRSGSDVYCWGSNEHGVVGDGDASVPTRRSDLPF